MSRVLQQTDPFNLTFGKQNWANIKQNKQNITHQGKSPQIKGKKSFSDWIDQNKKFCKRTLINQNFGQINCQFNKNNLLKDSSNKRKKRRLSIFDNQKKIVLNSPTIRQEVIKQKLSFGKQNKTAKYLDLYDIQLNKRLKHIEKISFQKHNKQRATSLVYQQPNYYQNNKIDKTLVLYAQNGKKTVKNSTIYQPTYRYRQDISKIDGLIAKINNRIKISIKNVS